MSGTTTASVVRWARDSERVPLVAAIVAGGLAALTWASGWHGGDFPAALHRIDLFRSAGFTLWDSSWFGGLYTLGYSVLLAPLADLVGVGALVAACAALSAWAFARLLRSHFGAPSWVGAVWFAIGLAAPIAIGQLAFVLGATLALLAVLAMAARRRVLAAMLGVLCPLASPVAAVLLLLVLAAWMVTIKGPGRRSLIMLGVAVAVPGLAIEVLFPQSGTMPFAATTLGGVLLASILGLWLLPRGERSLRIGAGMYGLAGLALFLVPQAMGANWARLGTAIAGPIVATVLWPRRRLLLAAVAVPLLLYQWIPAIGSVVKDHPDPSQEARYFSPLASYLGSQQALLTRIEILPTYDHWESLWASADNLQMARGWERQLDIANNSLFYTPGTLDAATYQAWLDANGVSWVALPNVSLDYSAQQESALVKGGLPYLTPVWQTSQWRLWKVVGSPGLVTGAAQVISIGTSSFELDVHQAGLVVVRLRYSRYWTPESGRACISSTLDGWTSLEVAQPGRLLVGSKLIGGGDGCVPGTTQPAV